MHGRHIAACSLLLLLLSTFFQMAQAAQTEDVGVTRSASLAIPAKPFLSRAQLDAYLRDTPAGKSPLDWLTSAGRRRFLDSVVFGEQGLGGISVADLRYELTRRQAYVLLQLFGVQDYALDLDALTLPRPTAENPSGSQLEASYDRLLAAERGDIDLAARQRAVSGSYMADFAPLQAEARLSALGDHDLELLFRGAVLAFGISHQPAHLADMRRDFDELQRRHRVDRPHAGDLYDALLAAHRTEEARALLGMHASIERRPPPQMRSLGRIRPGQPSLWITTPGPRARELVRVRFNIRARAQVIVLASTGCHFSTAAARDIEADAQLSSLFHDYGQWVAPPSEITAFDAVREWNRLHPDLRLGIAFDGDALPMVARAETPVFYFLDHGMVVDMVVGWPDGGNLDALRRGWRKINLLH